MINSRLSYVQGASDQPLIGATIGEMFDRKMRGAAVDAADLYRRAGGRSEFTQRLFAETFGSAARTSSETLIARPRPNAA